MRKTFTRGGAIRTLITALLVGIITFAGVHNPSARPAGREKALTEKKPSTITATPIINLDRIDPLKRRFQADQGKVRLVTLLSPT